MLLLNNALKLMKLSEFWDNYLSEIKHSNCIKNSWSTGSIMTSSAISTNFCWRTLTQQLDKHSASSWDILLSPSEISKKTTLMSQRNTLSTEMETPKWPWQDISLSPLDSLLKESTNSIPRLPSSGPDLNNSSRCCTSSELPIWNLLRK